MKVELKLNGTYQLSIIPEDDLERAFLKALIEAPGDMKVDVPTGALTDGSVLLTKERK